MSDDDNIKNTQPDLDFIARIVLTFTYKLWTNYLSTTVPFSTLYLETLHSCQALSRQDFEAILQQLDAQVLQEIAQTDETQRIDHDTLPLWD